MGPWRGGSLEEELLAEEARQRPNRGTCWWCRRAGIPGRGERVWMADHGPRVRMARCGDSIDWTRRTRRRLAGRRRAARIYAWNSSGKPSDYMGRAGICRLGKSPLAQVCVQQAVEMVDAVLAFDGEAAPPRSVVAGAECHAADGPRRCVMSSCWISSLESDGLQGKRRRRRKRTTRRSSASFPGRAGR